MSHGKHVDDSSRLNSTPNLQVELSPFCSEMLRSRDQHDIETQISPIDHRLLINYIKLLTHLLKTGTISMSLTSRTAFLVCYLVLCLYAQLRLISIDYSYYKYISIPIYWATACKNGSPYPIGPLSIMSVLSCLSVTSVYCRQTVGWIRMPLAVEVGLGHATLC